MTVSTLCCQGDSEDVQKQWLPRVQYFGYETFAELRYVHTPCFVSHSPSPTSHSSLLPPPLTHLSFPHLSLISPSPTSYFIPTLPSPISVLLSHSSLPPLLPSIPLLHLLLTFLPYPFLPLPLPPHPLPPPISLPPISLIPPSPIPYFLISPPSLPHLSLPPNVLSLFLPFIAPFYFFLLTLFLLVFP